MRVAFQREGEGKREEVNLLTLKILELLVVLLTAPVQALAESPIRVERGHDLLNRPLR
jgi:hypothetical protein